MKDPLTAFAPEELHRYARHLSLGEVGPQGQLRLKEARVLVVGAGGLGSPAALYLAAAGVGTLGIVDGDRVELSNLQRQVLHTTAAVGRPKVDSARERLEATNPHVRVVTHPFRLTAANAMEIVAEYDLVVDGSDNFPTRYLVNDACILSGKPWVYGAILRWEGQLALFGTPGGPCYRCLFREPPPAGAVPGCAQAGVIGALPGVIGSLQALEAVKWIVGGGGEGDAEDADGTASPGPGGPDASPLQTAAGRLLVFDAGRLKLREIRVRPDPACPTCGAEARARVAADPTLPLPDYARICGDAPGTVGAAVAAGAGRGSIDPGPATPAAAGLGDAGRGGVGPGAQVPALSAPALARALSGEAPPLVVDVREGWEWSLGNLEAQGAVHLPLGALKEAAASPGAPVPPRLEQALREGRRLVVVCRAGGRSLEGALLLQAQGFDTVANLEGGLLAWAREVDPGVVVG
jgi:sulfur-carrier protein adenylyltransferase/sulfurtransferase